MFYFLKGKHEIKITYRRVSSNSWRERKSRNEKNNGVIYQEKGHLKERQVHNDMYNVY